MVGSQNASDDGDQGDNEYSEVKHLPVERPGAAKAVKAQILAGGYTKGLFLHNQFWLYKRFFRLVWPRDSFI